MVSPLWNQGDGAVTWGDGTTGITGTPTSGNSLINLPGLGGGFGAQGVSVFPDGNYIFWDDPGQGEFRHADLGEQQRRGGPLTARIRPTPRTASSAGEPCPTRYRSCRTAPSSSAATAT